MHLRAEQVNALATGDLGVQVVFLRDFAERDQLVRRDLSARYARHDRIRAVLLHVGQEVVVGVLQGCVRSGKDVVVPARREDRGDGRFADVATPSAAVRRDQRIERLDALDAHEVVELLAGVREVLAQVGVDLDAARLKFRIQQLRNQWRTAATPGACLGAAANRAEGGGTVGDGGHDCAFRDVVA